MSQKSQIATAAVDSIQDSDHDKGMDCIYPRPGVKPQYAETKETPFMALFPSPVELLDELERIATQQDLQVKKR